VFSTFLTVEVKKFMIYINYCIVWPMLIISYILFILSNINQLFINKLAYDVDSAEIYSQFALQEFDLNLFTLLFFIIHLTIFLFAIYTKILNNSLEFLKQKVAKIQEELNLDQNKLYQVLVNNIYL
jgi:hypothetical protein